MNNLFKSILFFLLAYFLLWLDWLAYVTGDLTGALTYLIQNAWPTLSKYLEFRMTSSWPLPALMSFVCLGYSWHLLRIWAIGKQLKEEEEDGES